MLLDEIVFDKGKENSQREAIQNKGLGEQAILNDNHNGWCHCKILEKGYDNEVYQVQIGDSRMERQFFYHDLKQLIIIKNNPNYPRPSLSIID